MKMVFYSMRIKIILFIFFVCLIPEQATGAVTYRAAETKDLEQILLCQEKWSVDDRQKLVLFPKEVRGKIIFQALEQGKFFLACNEQKEIVAFLKAFIIKDEELNNILCDELCCRGDKVQLLFEGSYHIPKHQIFNFEYKLVRQKQSTPVDEKATTYIYYGGAYTDPNYRKLGVGTQLQQYALSQLTGQVTTHVKEHGSRHLCYVYGQVLANASNQSPIRVFADFVKILSRMPSGAIIIDHRAYYACKPEFVFENGKLIPSFSDSGKGLGNILSYTFESNEE